LLHVFSWGEHFVLLYLDYLDVEFWEDDFADVEVKFRLVEDSWTFEIADVASVEADNFQHFHHLDHYIVHVLHVLTIITIYLLLFDWHQ
jgi:hypothetical protein